MHSVKYVSSGDVQPTASEIKFTDQIKVHGKSPNFYTWRSPWTARVLPLTWTKTSDAQRYCLKQQRHRSHSMATLSMIEALVLIVYGHQ